VCGWVGHNRKVRTLVPGIFQPTGKIKHIRPASLVRGKESDPAKPGGDILAKQR
jgi:hypothetical protein